ncbi:MAG: hypothetical protein COA76_14980 [Moritella sp.]|nr:MAG: hypothetical protein COA76_14980 [Moritella sp.]
MLDRNELRSIYEKYGFIEQCGIEPNVAVFSIKTGHYHNADIIPLSLKIDTEVTFKAYKDLGYACQIKTYASTAQVSKELFSGFFSLDSTRTRLKKDYLKFTDSLVKIHSDNATYSFINTQYNINGKLGCSTIVNEITSRLDSSKPILFLLEAAAGFGKTCSAFELVNHIVESNVTKVPLFSELARNRQAKIFRYVLLDEIDRSFPLLSSALVRAEIRNGNVPVILDGFDELLHESSGEDNNYEATEPMLETISELLTQKAKVVLTTRRTAIFDGDNFHQWMNAHEDDFDIIRIRIHEPKIEDWLNEDRLKAITAKGFPIQNLSNPVLLSFLRCISDEEFEEVSNEPAVLVDKYFESMLERERKRQDLFMSPDEQYKILRTIAGDMITYDYTSESREYICSLIYDNYQFELEKTRKLYPLDTRPTTDELVNKLASHALLDRSSKDSQGIGFVNEFVLGNFCADNIIDDKTMEWDGDKRFIEPAIQSYLPRSYDEKEILWDSLKFVLEFMNGCDKVKYNYFLTNELRMDLDGESIEELKINNINFGEKSKIIDSVFIDCQFTSCQFTLLNLQNVTFINCVFYSCYKIGENENNDIFFVGSNDNNSFIDSIIPEDIVVEESNDLTDCDIYILEKFYPRGSATFHKHRAIKAVCARNNQFNHYDTLQSIVKLKKSKYLLTPDKRSFLELNMDYVQEIKNALGRM